MDGMSMLPAPVNSTGMSTMTCRHKMIMHMTFFWGSIAQILFPGWPRSDFAMYALALVFVFLLSILVEWFSHYNFVGVGSTRFDPCLTRTLAHAVRVGLAYLVMLALMSFNVGVFIAAVAGHALEVLFFWSRLLRKSPRCSENT